MDDFHLFVSYSREDDRSPVNDAGEGWVTAFVRSLERRHAQYTGRELRIFLDRESIGEGTDWRGRLGQGLRQSRLFLAFLSPRYITSRNCLWEWEEYLRREHSTARGDDGLTPIFFVEPKDLRLQEAQSVAQWLDSMAAKYPWLNIRPERLPPEAERLAKPFAADVARRNKTVTLELHPWFEQGPQVLLSWTRRRGPRRPAPRGGIRRTTRGP